MRSSRASLLHVFWVDSEAEKAFIRECVYVPRYVTDMLKKLWLSGLSSGKSVHQPSAFLIPASGFSVPR